MLQRHGLIGSGGRDSAPGLRGRNNSGLNLAKNQAFMTMLNADNESGLDMLGSRQILEVKRDFS